MFVSLLVYFFSPPFSEGSGKKVVIFQLCCSKIFSPFKERFLSG